MWPELTSHLRAVDYNVGAVLAAFLLGFVIQFTLRQDAMTNTEFKIIFRVREFLLLHPSPSNLRNQLSSRGDYYSNPVIRDRKDGGNNLVTEQDYSHQPASVHADIYKLMENYKIRALWQKMRGVIEEEEKVRAKYLKFVLLFTLNFVFSHMGIRHLFCCTISFFIVFTPEEEEEEGEEEGVKEKQFALLVEMVDKVMLILVDSR